MSGNVWMFSDEIDDEDLEFMNHDYLPPAVCQCMNTFKYQE